MANQSNPFPDAYAAMDRTGVVVEGITDLRRELRQFAPDLLKHMNKQIETVLDPIVADGRQFAKMAARSSGRSMRGVTYQGRAGLPLSRWNQIPDRPGSRPSYAPRQAGGKSKSWEYDRLQWNTGSVVKGIRVGAQSPKMRGKTEFRGAWAILNRDPAGAVYELMGTGKSNTNMVQNVRGTSRVSGKRLIWRAWDKRRGDTWAPQQVVSIIRDYQQQFQNRMNRPGR